MKKKYSIKNIIIYKIGGKIKRFFFKIYEFFLPKFYIDSNLMQLAIKEFNLDKINSQLKESYKRTHFHESDNSQYFNNMLTYNHANKYLKNNPFFLYPPNVAVLDFLFKNFNKDVLFLDYACGLGNLQVYLKKMGFKNIFGYDNYRQIKKETIECFLNNFGLSNILIPKERALTLKNRVASCICYFWNKLEKELIEKEINSKDLEYILLDYYYAPRRIKNFKIAGIYNNLLIVFKRNEKN